MIRSCIVVVGCVISIASNSTAAVSQAESRQIIISSEITCPTCRIEAERIATLGAESDTLDFGIIWNASGMIARDRHGSFYVAPRSGTNPSVFVYDSSGRLNRQIGRRGQGPGEFTMPWSLALGAEDTLYVFNYFNRRMSVFLPDGLFVRSVMLPLVADQVLPMGDGIIVATGNRSTPGSEGLPLHLLTGDGVSLFAFGDEDPIVDRRYLENRRQISRASDGTVWSSRNLKYEIQRWDLDGHLVETIIREAEWFPPRDPEITEPLREVLPPKRVTRPSISWFHGSYQDDSGLLWLNSVVAARDWREHEIILGYEQPITPAINDKLYDTLIEVIDPVEGRLLASLRLPFYNFGFIGKNAIARERELESGLVQIEIWQVHFTNK